MPASVTEPVSTEKICEYRNQARVGRQSHVRVILQAAKALTNDFNSILHPYFETLFSSSSI